MDQSAPAPPGSGSWTLTPVAAPGPALESVIVKPIVAPRLTGLASAVLARLRFGQLTVIGTGPTVGLPSLVELAEALLLTVGQVPDVVGLVMWTWTLAPAARSTPAAPPKLRMPPVRVQAPVVLATSIDQFRPVFVGTVSVTLTPWAVPAPVFVRVRT